MNTKKALLAVAVSLFAGTAHADELILPVYSKYYGDNVDRFNTDTFGAGVSFDTIYDKWGVTGGTFRNAFDRQSNWLAMAYRTRVFDFVKLGADFGAVSGYGKNRTGSYNGIVPSIVPVIGVRTSSGFGLDAAFLPPVSTDTTWMVNFRLVAPL
jgi:hypothetical protein